MKKKKKQDISNEMRGESSPCDIAISEIKKLMIRYSKKAILARSVDDKNNANLYVGVFNIIESIYLQLFKV